MTFTSRSRYQGSDRFLYPVVVDATNNSIAFTEGATQFTVSIDPGIYWAHLDGSANTAYPSILLSIEAALNGATETDATYEFSELDLSTSELGFSSLKLSQTADPSNESFSLRFSSGDFTLNPGYFGFNREETTDKTGTDFIDGDVSVLGQWQSPKSAAYKTRQPQSRTSFRSDPGPNARINAWSLKKISRAIKYHKLQASHIFQFRAEDPSSATRAGLPEGDTNNAFEDFWAGLHTGAPCLMIYDRGGETGAMTFNLQAPRVNEAVQLKGSGTSLDEILSELTKWEGEHYTVDFEVMLREDDTTLEGYRH